MSHYFFLYCCAEIYPLILDEKEVERGLGLHYPPLYLNIFLWRASSQAVFLGEIWELFLTFCDSILVNAADGTVMTG